MINVKNKIIRLLRNHTQKPITPNTETKGRPPYPFVDYSITSLRNDNGEGNYSYKENGINFQGDLELQKRLSLSFNVYSRNEEECYSLAKSIWNYFKHGGIEELSSEGIVVIDVMEIANRSILEVNKYEMRYGFDVFIRFDDKISRIEEFIDLEDAGVAGEIIKE